MEKKQADVSREFGLVNSTTQMIWKKETKIMSVFKRNGLRIKWLLKPEQSGGDEALLQLREEEECERFSSRVNFCYF
jgi:hypothetical protein